MNTVTITGLSRVTNAKPNKGGSTIIAHFDCEANGFGFRGCALVRTPKNGLTVWMPKIEGPESARRAVDIADCSLRHALMLHAREAYRALGGQDAEWIGRSIPNSPQENEDLAAQGIERVRVRRKQHDDKPDDETEGLERFLATSAA
jgi:hypothetical protein